MNTAKACDILELKTPFTHRELKNAYHKSALKKHPDKQPNTIPEIATSEFQNIQSAYELLSIQLELKEDIFHNINIANDNTIKAVDYTTILKNFIYACLEIKNTTIPDAIKGIAEKALSGLDKKILQELLQYINTYGAVLANTENLNIIVEIIQEKIQESNIYNIEVTLDNLFQAEIFKLNVENEVYYIPLWHNEIEYDKDYTRLVVKCIPNIPKHVSIDDDNNIHVNIKLCVKTLLHMKYVDIFLGNKVFKIPIAELYIRQVQDYVFYKKGIPIINQEDIYSAERVSDIIVHISLH